MRKLTGPLALTGLILGGLAVAASLATFGPHVEGWQIAARYTARLSFFLFILTYLTAPLASLFPAWRVVKRERRGLGLAFAGAHFVHLGALTAFLQVSGQAPALVTVILGGFAFVMIAIMALTSNDAAARALGPANWRRLHTFGLHYIWFIFVATYARRVPAHPDMPEYVALLALALSALVIRLGVGLSSRLRTS